MKDYSQMAADVFRRRDEYKAVRQQRRHTAAKSAAIFTCFLFIITAAGIAVSGNIVPSKISKTPYNTPVDISDGITDSISDSTSVYIQNNDSDNFQNTVIINKIEGISSSRMNICLLQDDFVPMNKGELKEYYGTAVFPSVPADLKEWNIENEYAGYGIYRRENGSGEIYWDQNVINYSNNTYTRSVNIELHKGGLPFSDYGQLSSDGRETCANSVINGETVRIGRTESGYYLTEFIHKNVGFRMITEGLSEDELIEVISSLIEPKNSSQIIY